MMPFLKFVKEMMGRQANLLWPGAKNTLAGKMSPRHFVLPLRDVRLLQYGDLHEFHVFRGGHLHDIPHWGAPEVHDVEELGARQVHDMEETKLVNKKGAISNH